MAGIDIYDQTNVEDGKAIDLQNWKIVPMRLIHNVECYGFLIYSKIDKKKVVYITDSSFICKFGKIDCLICDCNYDEDILNHCIEQGLDCNLGCRNHLSIQQVEAYLQTLTYKIPHIVAFHLSNSNLANSANVLQILQKYSKKCYIAKKNLEFSV